MRKKTRPGDLYRWTDKGALLGVTDLGVDERILAMEAIAILCHVGKGDVGKGDGKGDVRDGKGDIL